MLELEKSFSENCIQTYANMLDAQLQLVPGVLVGPRGPLRLPRPQQTMPIAAAVAVVSAEAADWRRPPPTAFETRTKQLFHLVAAAIAHQWTDMKRGKRPLHTKGGQKNLPGTIDGLWLKSMAPAGSEFPVFSGHLG